MQEIGILDHLRDWINVREMVRHAQNAVMQKIKKIFLLTSLKIHVEISTVFQVIIPPSS